MLQVTENEVITTDGNIWPLYWADILGQDRQGFFNDLLNEWTPTPGKDNIFHQTLFDRIEYRMENFEEDIEEDINATIYDILNYENDTLLDHLKFAKVEGIKVEDVSEDLTQELFNEYLSW